MQLFFPFILVVGIFYLLIIRPMRTRQKNLENLIGGLKNGDKVITTGGIYGTISGVRDHTFVLKVADQVDRVLIEAQGRRADGVDEVADPPC